LYIQVGILTPSGIYSKLSFKKIITTIFSNLILVHPRTKQIAQFILKCWILSILIVPIKNKIENAVKEAEDKNRPSTKFANSNELHQNKRFQYRVRFERFNRKTLETK
jgi:hypothetical protein